MSSALTESGTIGSFIDGQWRPTETTRASYNPAHPDQEVVRFGVSTSEDIDAAFMAAKRALPGWAGASQISRGQILRRAAELVVERRGDLAGLICQDQGKTLKEAGGEVDRTIETLYYHAGQSRQETGHLYASSNPAEQIRVVRRPVGIVGVVTPFNFPLVIPSWKIAPALLYGNVVVWKPASLAPAAAIAFTNILHEAGLPAGVLNLVVGDGAVGASVASHPLIDAITFTGSVPVGQGIAELAVKNGVAAQMELGGHNAAVIFEDADLPRAAASAIAGAMLGAGQKCTSTRRIIVVEQVYEQFLPFLVQELNKLRVGDGFLEDVDLGPLISVKARDDVAAAVEQAIGEGAESIVGGVVVGDLDEGGYQRPTLLTNVTSDMTIAQQEVFGPVASVILAKDADEAIQIANATEFGLATSIFTADEQLVIRCINEIEVGVLRVNSPTTGAEPHVPFTGRKHSSSAGSPAEQGETARDFFTVTRTVYAVPR